jgi:hypothetical protein
LSGTIRAFQAEGNGQKHPINIGGFHDAIKEIKK